MEPIYLSNRQLKALESKKLGSGSEAHVYKVDDNLLYKIYHNEISRRIALGELNKMVLKSSYDDSDVKIVKNIKDVKSNMIKNPFLTYYDKEGVKLYHKNAILKAIQKQSNIEYSSLPQAPIYKASNGKLIGCVLKYHKNHINLHSLSFLPNSMKIKLMKKILRNVEELLKENIYHVDLSNKKVSNNTHSNILVSYKLEPQIIDIDGRSAIYTEKVDSNLSEEDKNRLDAINKNLLYSSYASLSALLLDYIYDEDIISENLETELDILMMQKRLLKNGLPLELSEKLINSEAGYDEINEVLSLKLKR